MQPTEAATPQELAQLHREIRIENRAYAHAQAEKCSHCGRSLPTGYGTHLEYIGVVGPECVQKYGPLLAILKAVDGLEAHEHDQGSIRLAYHTYHDLRRAGVAVKLLNVRPGVKALQIEGLSRKPKLAVQSYGEMREAFENRLKLAAAERAEQAWVAA